MLGAALVVALPAAGGAHAFLVKSSPARVELWFNERIEPAYSGLTVVSAAGERVDHGDVTIGPDDPRQLSVTLSALEPGRYVVRFRVVSVDSHVVESSFEFSVK